MNRIVASVTTLEQHVAAIEQMPKIYRPPTCPHGGIKIVWQHGCYTRKADRRQQGEPSLNSVPILRYCMLSMRAHLFAPAAAHRRAPLAPLVGAVKRAGTAVCMDRPCAIRRGDDPIHVLPFQPPG
jgi:hypothetical protein